MNSMYGDRLDATIHEIRLLRLHPSNDDECVSCSLTRTSLQTGNGDAQSFNALSYAWGDPNIKTRIRIDGFDAMVTTNLESALRRLRTYRPQVVQDLPLWVDALCINQQDLEERNQQVSMMGNIFRAAERVLVWLGESDDMSDLAFSLFESPTFKRQVERREYEIGAFIHSEPGNGAALARMAALQARAGIDLSIERRSWWNRV